MVDKPYFYPIKTVNNTFFLEENHQTHSVLGTNNLVPHVHVIIWMQVCNRLLFRVKKLYMKVGLPPQNAQLENQLHIHQSHSFWRQCAKDGHISGVGRSHLCGPSTTTVLIMSPGSHLQKMNLWFYQSGINRSHYGAIQPPGLHQPTCMDSFQKTTPVPPVIGWVGLP